MPDVDLRQLERAAAQGDTGAAERLLRERLRRSLTDRERVGLAAWLGDPAATAVIPEAASDPALDVLGFFDGLSRWGRAVAVRAAAALARSFAPAVATENPLPPQVTLVEIGPTRAELELEPGRPIVIGRGSAADLRIAEERVSRRHCEVALAEDGSVTARDLGSKNGTWLGIEALGSEPTRIFDGNVLRLSSAAVELRIGNVLPGQSCLDAVLAWLDAPTPAVADVVDRTLDALDPALQSPFDLAARAAAHTVLSDPPSPAFFLERIESGLDPAFVRRVVRRALLPLALGDRPLPQLPDPPARVARASRPRDDPRWRAQATVIEAVLGLRAQRRLMRWPRDRQGPILALGPDGALEQIVEAEADELEPEDVHDELIRAAALLERVEHPHLAPFLGCHVETDAYGGRRLFFRSRHPGGVDLTTWLADGPLDPAVAVAAFRDVASAAQPVMELARVPIDPDNVWRDPAGRAVLAGVMGSRAQRFVPLHPTASGGGWLAFVSPEEATDSQGVEPLTNAVYHLGGLLFLALTGRPPFAMTSARVLLEILDKPPPAPSSLRAGLSPELDAVVFKALEKRGADRYPGPAAFAAALSETPEASGA